MRTWTTDQFEAVDGSHERARTGFREEWDKCFRGPCPHGVECVWLARPAGVPLPLCRCGGKP